MIFSELQTEVARRALRNNSTQYTQAIKNAINASLYRLGREAYWRVLRRKSTLNTVTSYTTGSGAVSATNGSANITITGATLITDDIQIGRLITFQGSTQPYTISEITGETTLVVDRVYSGTSGTDLTYEILPQEEYNLPAQATHRCFIWHNDYGYPYLLHYITDQEFWSMGLARQIKQTPTHYRMWGVNMVIEQIKTPSVITVASSSDSDTSQVITIYGNVSGYPDQESITVTGTTSASGSKSFQSVERVVRVATTASVGRITVTANSGNTTLAVFPVGNSTEGIQYRKIQLFPFPTRVFPLNIYYYKDVYGLFNDNDVHELGEQFDEAIILLSSSKLQLETGQQEGTNFATLYSDEVKNLRKTNVDKMDYLAILNRGSRKRLDPLIHPNLSYAQIGGYYGPVVR